MWETLGTWGNEALLWVGFGTLVGLTAKAILPGRDPGGPFATVLMGGGGTAVGAGVLALIWGQRIKAISPIGFVAATLGTMFLLVIHHMLNGRYFREDGTGTKIPFRGMRRRVTTTTRDVP